MKKLNKPVRSTPLAQIASKENIQPRKDPTLSQNYISSTSLINNMKLQLSSIKIDVEKLMKEDCYVDQEASSAPYRLQIQNEDLRGEVGRIKQDYQKLKGEYEKCRKEEKNRAKKYREQQSANKELQAKIQKIEAEKANVQIQKLRLETEYHRVEGIMSKLQKQQGMQQEFQSKMAEEKLKLQAENLKIQGELKRTRAESREGQKWKQECECLKQLVDELETQIKAKQEHLWAGSEEVIKLKGELQQMKQQHLDRFAQLERTKELQHKLEQQQIRFQELRREADMTMASEAARKREQDIAISKLETEIVVLKKEKEGLEEVIRSVEQTSAGTDKEKVQQYSSKLRQLTSRLNDYEAQNKDLRARLQQLYVSKTRQSSLAHEITEKNRQIAHLRFQLEAARKLQTIVASSQSEQIAKLANSRVSKTHYQIQLQNKVNEMETLKKKMQALNKKIDMKSNQLKQKDEFINNVIVNKAKREGTDSEIEHIKGELGKYFSATLYDRLVSAEEQIASLKGQIEQLKAQSMQ